MSDVIEELSGDSGELDQARVVARVENWKNRVSTLYGQLSAWLPSRFSTDTRLAVMMHEELMKKYSVPATELPVLNVYDDHGWKAKLVPRGLWIIGANGRLDLFTHRSQTIVVDRGENFAEPIWQIAPAAHRRELAPLTRDTWLNALGV